MSAPITAADVLRAALTELRRPLNEDGNGWAQHKFGSGDRCKCAIGAVIFAVDGMSDQAGRPVFQGSDLERIEMTARCTLFEALWPGRCADGQPSSAIVGWNDTPGRTFPEVESAFERAIELAEAGAR